MHGAGNIVTAMRYSVVVILRYPTHRAYTPEYEMSGQSQIVLIKREEDKIYLVVPILSKTSRRGAGHRSIFPCVYPHPLQTHRAGEGSTNEPLSHKTKARCTLSLLTAAGREPYVFIDSSVNVCSVC